jgi:hypothetical protein
MAAAEGFRDGGMEMSGEPRFLRPDVIIEPLVDDDRA